MDVTLIVVTLVSLALAVVMATLAWRLAREERRRSNARVAALAAEIHGEALPAAVAGGLRGAVGSPERFSQLHEVTASRAADAAVASRDLFAAAQPPETESRLAVVLALGVLVVVGGAGFAVLTAHRTTPAAASSSSRTAPAAPDATPLELVALTHERDADRLTVRGIIRNPASGGEIGRLTAVVFLFDRDGGFVSSGRGAVAQALRPGVESPFEVTIPGVTDVGRYRVSFRTDDRIVSHVDRRDRAAGQAK